jgi:hypothetical protein
VRARSEFLVIFPTYGAIDTVRRTLPSVVRECAESGAALMIHDSTEQKDGRDEKWALIREISGDDRRSSSRRFVTLSDNLSVAHARNSCLRLGQELFCPEFICVLEDDHGLKPGFVGGMTRAMREHYGRTAPNGLHFGLFSGCLSHCFTLKREALPAAPPHPAPPPERPHLYPLLDNIPFHVGGVNNCCRCAPTSHWNNVLKEYNSDEYYMSRYQTIGGNVRNYNKGFTWLLVESGTLMFDIDHAGRGVTDPHSLPLWDEEFCASDARARFRGGANVDIENAPRRSYEADAWKKHGV